MALSLEEQNFADRTITAHLGRPGALLGILERVQEHHPNKFLSSEILEYVASKTDVPLSQLYSVVTFYALSTWSRRATTPSASAVGPRATRAGRATCCNACASNSGFPRKARTARTSFA